MSSHSPEKREQTQAAEQGRGRIVTQTGAWWRVLLGLLLLPGLLACGGLGLLPADSFSLPTLAAPASAPPESPPPRTPVSLRPTYTPVPSPTPIPAHTSTPSPTPSPTATANPYEGLSIAELAARPYGGGALRIVETMEYRPTFTRYLITYPSDGLTLYGFMDVPEGEGEFPVAIVLHGYVDPDEYRVKDYTTRYADALAEAGYFVIHPTYRNHPPSDNGPNPYRIGYAIDVMNLIAIVKEQSLDATGVLRRADGNNIYLWGHSMGGGIALRVITVWPEAVRAAVLYGAMSGDEALNYERISAWSEGREWEFEMSAPSEVLQTISPISYLDRIQAPVSIHHGVKDVTVPPAWSEQLCRLLTAGNHVVECFRYEGQGHTFYGDSEKLFEDRVLSFFAVW